MTNVTKVAVTVEFLNTVQALALDVLDVCKEGHHTQFELGVRLGKASLDASKVKREVDSIRQKPNWVEPNDF